MCVSSIKEGCEQERDEFNHLNLTHGEQGSTTGGGSHVPMISIYDSHS